MASREPASDYVTAQADPVVGPHEYSSGIERLVEPDQLPSLPFLEALPVTPPKATGATVRRDAKQLIQRTIAGLLAVCLVGFLAWNRLLANQLTEQRAQGAALQAQMGALQAEVQDLKERWFGSPALWQPPPISNTDIEFFDVSGRIQQELIKSLNNSPICNKYGGCPSDPAVPNAVAWGFGGVHPVGSGYWCDSPRATTLAYRGFVVLPRWSPPADGSVKIPLVERWNSLAQVIYTHEAGHVAIGIRDVAELNDHAHQLPSCRALIDFWTKPSVFDKLNADQNAYHAQLQADCRAEIGCIPPGWLGWS